MSDEIPYRPRRWRSMDSLSTLDTPAPPYGLVDPTYRPGSIRSIPVPVSSASAKPPSPLRTGYRIRVGKLEIRRADRWDSRTKGIQFLELDVVDRVLSPKMTAIIALFENAIKRGHKVLILIRPFFTKVFTDIDKFYRRLRTLWFLCITTGAALCEYEGTVSQYKIEWLSESMSWICDSLMQGAIEKAQQLGLSDATRAASGELPVPTIQQTKVVESWARDMNKTFGRGIDRVTQGLSDMIFLLHLKPFEE